jgi:hypothetical protein
LLGFAIVVALAVVLLLLPVATALFSHHAGLSL